MKTVELKVGTHRGNKRVWIQGDRLVEAGFTIGKKYITEISKDAIVLDVVSDQYDHKPTRKVSRKPAAGAFIPVIDMNSKKMTEFFGDCCSCVIEFNRNWIVITRGV